MKIRTTKIYATALFSMLLLGGCTAAGNGVASQESKSPSAEQSSEGNQTAGADFTDFGISGMTAVELVNYLDQQPISERSAQLRASVRPTEVLLSSTQGAEESVAIPGDQFYLSFAPYISQTHECYFHSLTTCKGELGGKEIAVKITRTDGPESTAVLLDETLTTFDNGFAGVWLPRGITADLEVTYNGKRATAPISTVTNDDATCLTTLQLK